MGTYDRRTYLGVAAGGVALAAGYPATTTATGRSRAGEGSTVAVTILETTQPVAAGASLEVTAWLENAGDEPVTETVRLEVGDEVVDTASVTVPAGGTTRAELGYETYPVASTVRFPVTVTGEDDADERLVTVFGTDDAPIARISPDSAITVRPGSTVLFEAAVPEPQEVEWYVGEAGPLPNLAEMVLGPTAYLGRAAISPTFETAGQRDVRVVYDEETVRWTVDVDPGGTGPPTIETLTSEPGEDERAGPTDTLEVTATVSHPAGELGRVLWYEPGNALFLRESAVSGDRDTATGSWPLADAYWIERGYETMAVPVSADGVVGDPASVPGPAVRPPFAVSIVDATDPVAAGDRLEVTVEVTNDGTVYTGPDTQELALVVGGEVVDTASVNLELGETTTITLGYATYPVEQDVTFPVTVTSPDDADERTVEVVADDPEPDDPEPALAVTITGTTDPVDAGEFLQVSAALENVGETTVSQDVRLEVGGEVVDTDAVTVGAGETTTVDLGYETYPVERDVEFPVTVATDDDADEQVVSVSGA